MERNIDRNGASKPRVVRNVRTGALHEGNVFLPSGAALAALKVVEISPFVVVQHRTVDAFFGARDIDRVEVLSIKCHGPNATDDRVGIFRFTHAAQGGEEERLANALPTSSLRYSRRTKEAAHRAVGAGEAQQLVMPHSDPDHDRGAREGACRFAHPGIVEMPLNPGKHDMRLRSHRATNRDPVGSDLLLGPNVGKIVEADEEVTHGWAFH